MNNRNFSIFVSSADSYSDLWPLFFCLFKSHWPSYDGLIYLNTEVLDYQYDGLNIICTKVGKKGSFGRVFRAGLDLVKDENVLLFMVDYLIMGQVDNASVNRYYEAFCDEGLDSLCFMASPFRECIALDVLDLRLVVPPSRDMFSYQVAFWNKRVLREMALPHESPWLSEWYGTARANQMNIKLAFSSGGDVIKYLAEGALHKGKWVAPMVEYLDRNGYDVDYGLRGVFTDVPPTLWSRINGRWVTFWPRLLSNWDLLKRQLKAKA